MKNLVSVIMNCYNGEEYLEKSLKSVIMQKYNNWELIFWDNQSTDNSKKIFKSFSDERLKYFYSEKNTTLYEARNNASKIAKGEYIGFIDCDDEWYDDYLSSRKTFFENNSFDYSYSNFHYFYEKNNIKVVKSTKYLKGDLIYDFLAKSYVVAISGLIFKKKILNEINFFNPAYNIIGDYELVMKIASKYLCYSRNTPSVNCSFHGENYSIKNRDEYAKEFNKWYQKIDFNEEPFSFNKIQINNNLLYINLFEDITTLKRPNQLLKIFKIKDLYKKMKLLIIFILPDFLIKKLLNKY